MNKSFYKTNLTDIFFIFLGSILGAVGINMFLAHAKLLSGGASGIALIFQYLFGIDAGYLVLLINIPLFVLGFMKLNKRFMIYTFVGTITLSAALVITNPISNILHINDKLLYCIYGGVVNGIGYGLVFTHHGSTGGLDIISMVIRKHNSNFNVGKTNFYINFFIVAISAFIFGLPSALYTLIAMYISSFVLDYVIKGFNRSKCVIIITDKENEVRDYIMNKVKRGITYLYGEGAFTHKEKRVIFCVISLAELPNLKKAVSYIDDKAFFTIFDTSEVRGLGFKSDL
ncbi:YitT family protein [Clostridium oryzae]|uniref:DUF2179 domain-containing protein n=1 Tax=Clostridium oryzae TaxID=1450648 RepID=A0A1V4IRU7_9CLOT|nr:YitT family protein [Clostridium oryzae]OPJ62742.1 hypothetical protein CLORY_16220 [Clostridium oryzae]